MPLRQQDLDTLEITRDEWHYAFKQMSMIQDLETNGAEG